MNVIIGSNCGTQRELGTQQSGPPGEEIIATYSNRTITAADLVNFTMEEYANASNPLLALQGLKAPIISANEPAKMPTEDQLHARRVEWVTQTIQTIAFRRTIAERAIAEKLDRSEQYKALLQDWYQLVAARRVQFEEIADKITIVPQEIDEYYQNNPSEFVIPAHFDLRGIYVLKDREGRTPEEARRKIEEARQKILEGEDFVMVAQKYSEAEDITKAGMLMKNLTESTIKSKEIIDALLAIPEMQVTDVLEIQGSEKDIYGIYRADKKTPRVERQLDDALRFEILNRIYKDRYTQFEQTLFRTLMLEFNPEYHPEWFSTKPENPDDPIIEIINPDTGETIFSKGFKEFVQQAVSLGYASIPTMKNYLDILAGRALAYAFAVKKGWMPETLEARLSHHRNQILTDLYLNSLVEKEIFQESDFRQYYDTHTNEFITDRVMAVYYIFVPAKVTPESDALQIQQAVLDSFGIGSFILGELSQGKPFPLLAAEYSKDPLTAGNRGFMGLVTYDNIRRMGRFYEKFMEALPNMKPGEISEAYMVANHTTGRFGTEIYFLEDEQPERQMTYEESGDRLAAIFVERTRNRIEKELFDEIMASCNPQIDIDAGLETLAFMESCANHPIQALKIWDYAPLVAPSEAQP